MRRETLLFLAVSAALATTSACRKSEPLVAVDTPPRIRPPEQTVRFPEASSLGYMRLRDWSDGDSDAPWADSAIELRGEVLIPAGKEIFVVCGPDPYRRYFPPGPPLEDLSPLLELPSAAVRTMFLILGGAEGLDVTQTLEAFPFLERLAVTQGNGTMRTRITNRMLAPIRQMAGLKELSLSSDRITDAGLEHLQHLPLLEKLTLFGTGFTDRGLVSLESLSSLQVVIIENRRITDAGLVHFEGLKNLRELQLWGTAVTPQGVARLKAKSPVRWVNLRPSRVGTPTPVPQLQPIS